MAWVTPARPWTPAAVRLSANLMIGAGALFGTIDVIVLALMTASRSFGTGGEVLVGSTIWAGLFLWLGIDRLRRAARFTGNEPVTFGQPFPFAITDDTVEFPSGVYAPAARWHRQTTVATLAGSGWWRRLRLSAPGQRPRRYFQRTVEQPLEDLAQRIAAR